MTLFLKSIYDSVAEATVDFTRSNRGEESRKAVQMAGSAVADIGRGTASAWSAAIPVWKESTKELEDIESSEEYIRVFSKALKEVTQAAEVKQSLSLVVDGANRTVKEILNATKLVISSLSAELSSSPRFREALAEIVSNLTLLLSVIGELSGRALSDAVQGKLLPESTEKSEK